MRIEFNNLKRENKALSKDINRKIESIIISSDFILGKELTLFENEFAEYIGTKFSIGVSSGTDALFLGMKVLGIEKGDEVILPVNTYIATAMAVSQTGAKPVFVDCEEDTYNMDLQKVESKITKNTKAIIPVHLYGNPVDMTKLKKIAKRNDLLIVEDCCQAAGTEFNKRKAGSFGNIGCFSFYPSKTLGALGNGGAITTNSKKLVDKLRMLNNYGQLKRDKHEVIGYNKKLDTIQAAVLREKLKRLDEWIKKRREVADEYKEKIKGAIHQRETNNGKHSYCYYTIITKERDKIRQALLKKGVDCKILYPKIITKQKPFFEEKHFEIAERLSKEILSIPINPFLKRNELKLIIKTINDAL